MSNKSILTKETGTYMQNHKEKTSLFKMAMWPVMVLLALFTWQCKKDTFKGETQSICPVVVSTDPANGDTNVVISKRITATFNEVMNVSTINTSTFLLYTGSTQVPGIVSYVGKTAIFDPAGYLDMNTLYTARITTGSQDPDGNALEKDYVWTFKTGMLSVADQPTVIATDPFNGETAVALNRKVTAEFSKSMNPASINGTTFTLQQGANMVSGTVSYVDNTATFIPSTGMIANSVYTGTITTGAKDNAGNALANNYTWNFTTGNLTDTVRPIVVATDPIFNANNVELSKTVTARFSETMDPLSINATSFTLKEGLNTVAGIVSYSGITASFNPANDLMPSTSYTATITTGAKDLAGNTLAVDYVWNFTTGTNTINGQATIDLRSAAPFAVLAGSGVTNTGLTIINGNLGTSPTGTVNGFPPGKVNGSIHAANPIAAQAKIDLTTAFNEAQGRSTGAVSLPGDISGLTLAPGLYSNSTSVILSAGSVTIDAQGDPNAIFIFKMGSTFTSSPGTSMILIGGAQAKNIFWSVGTSATLGTNSIFYGNILADQSISLNTGATLNGRALTRIGAVTLQSNIVNKP
jgi:hypothetical protein